MKKLFSLFFALVATTALWAYDFQFGDLYYNITSSGEPYTVVVTYESNWSDYNYWGLTSAVIPETVTYDGTTYSVTSIGDLAFRDCSSLTSVTIGSGVTSIGSFAFSRCSGLTSVVWNAENCAGFYESAPFYDFRSQITSFTFGDSVKHIPASLCYGMTKLPAITLPNSITSIGSSAFYDCSKLTSITIPDSVTSIGSYAFYGCSGLTSITIPHSVSIIGESAFSGCSGLTSVIWNAENITNNYEYSFGSFVYSPPFYDSYDSSSQITSFTFGDSVRHIPAYLCYGMKNLTAVTIGNSVTSIGCRAFYKCSILTSITIPDSVTTIADEAFRDCSSLTAITIPNSVTSIGQYAFQECSKLTSVTIPNSVTSIGSGAFSRTGIYNDESNWKNGVLYISNCLICADEDEVSSAYIIKEGTRLIADYAFGYCSSLTSVTLPNSITSIGSSAFYDCSKLTSITIPDSVTSIGDWVFCGCSKLTSVTIPKSVTSIGSSAFSWCESLKEVICYAEKVPEMGEKVFDNTPQNKATLYVLADALEDYKAAEQWKEFCTILPIQETENDLECIISPSANTHKFVRNGQIIIIRDGKTYNAQGAVIN